MKKKEFLSIFLNLLCYCSLISCKKFLEKIPDSSQTAPKTIQDLQHLLDNDVLTQKSTPGLGVLGSDDYFLSYPTWNATEPVVQNVYLWEKQPYPGQSVPGWDNAYKTIFYANSVLDDLGNVDPGTTMQYNTVKGTALFLRSFKFFELEENFGQPYRPMSANTDSGIFLRIHASPATRPARAVVGAVFTRIIGDLRQAFPLLPVRPDTANLNRPSRAATFALLARVCLTTQDYTAAGAWADSCLHLYDSLLDYNVLDTVSPRPFPMTANPELLLQCSTQTYLTQYLSTTAIDTALYASYDSNDLRRTLFFGRNDLLGTHYFKGQYTGLAYLFSGLATDEVYLIRAECHAQNGDKDAALSDLNHLLSARWKTGTFIPYTAATATQALRLILQERRKETLFRDLRWSDLRRLNQDKTFAKTLERVLNGEVYLLSPGDPRYTYPIPDNEWMPN